MDWSTQGGTSPSHYDSFLVPAMFAPLAEHLVHAAEIDAGMQVLDIACGTGVLARAAARASGDTGRVTAVDLSAPMLQIARSHAPEPGAAPIRYLAAPAENLPRDVDESFDVITCQQGLQFFPDRPAALRAMRSRCAAGGLVAIATWTALEDTIAWVSLADAVGRHIGDERARCCAPPTGSPIRPRSGLC